MRASWRSRSPGSGRRVRHLRRKNDLQPMTSSIFNFCYSFTYFCFLFVYLFSYLCASLYKAVCFYISLSILLSVTSLYLFFCLSHLFSCWYFKKSLKIQLKFSEYFESNLETLSTFPIHFSLFSPF